MVVPATTGQMRTRIEEMEIGDYIPTQFWFSSTATGNPTITNSNGAGYEWPINDSVKYSDVGSNYGRGGMFYFVKVAKGLLIGDRILFRGLSWLDMNRRRLMEGKEATIFGITGIMRSITGGVAFATASGERSLTDTQNGGWPKNNEWDRYVVNFPRDLIQEGQTYHQVFNDTYLGTMCQDTPATNGAFMNGNASPSNRIVRGKSGNIDNPIRILSATNVPSDMGFRAVFEYEEVW